jgi:hypothetical protein
MSRSSSGRSARISTDRPSRNLSRRMKFAASGIQALSRLDCGADTAARLVDLD